MATSVLNPLIESTENNRVYYCVFSLKTDAPLSSPETAILTTYKNVVLASLGLQTDLLFSAVEQVAQTISPPTYVYDFTAVVVNGYYDRKIYSRKLFLTTSLGKATFYLTTDSLVKSVDNLLIFNTPPSGSVDIVQAPVLLADTYCMLGWHYESATGAVDIFVSKNVVSPIFSDGDTIEFAVIFVEQ